MDFTCKALNYPISQTQFYRDSTIVLAWVGSHASRWKTFVANRVAKIQTLSSATQWHHISGSANPAYLATRDVLSSTLLTSIWLCDPKFLHETFPFQTDSSVPSLNDAVPEERYCALQSTIVPNHLPDVNGPRDVIRHLIRKCIKCCKVRASITNQMMSDLPYSGISPALAFMRCGVDYVGPFQIKIIKKVEVPNPLKHTQLCLFVCFTTGAIHLELVTDLSADAVIVALKSTSNNKILHGLIFDENGDRKNRSRLREFSGFCTDFNVEETETKIIKEFTFKELIAVCNLLHLEFTTKLESCCDIILTHLCDLSLFKSTVLNSGSESDLELNEKSPPENRHSQPITSNLATLCDTGSQATIINEKTYQKLGYPTLNPSHCTFSGIGRDRVESKDAIIGIDFLQQTQFTFGRDGIRIFRDADECKNDDVLINLANLFDEQQCKLDLPHISNSKICTDVEQLVSSYKPKKIYDTDLKMTILLSDDIPVSQRFRRLPFVQQKIVENLIQEWLNANIIKPSCSDYAAPIVLCKKKNGEHRLCVDYRNLNRKMIQDKFPLPLIEEVLDKLENSKVYTSLDLKNGFFHVPMDPNSAKYTSFVTHEGQYEFLHVPFGLSNSRKCIPTIYLHCLPKTHT
ncbi:hypothetical protein TNCV_4153231 [Trichonephila clavipes]|nr:hypothetical protein TNCV_4153231 [Trichonephila clavipes]